ncbi:MAG: DUF2970 domain-containing protein [Pseudohongiella sp.]|nr:DUF2970 domain-containing protein [Pseudohongiella sp.]MDP2379638.1 DUF2970 domain-containing protein [Pseudohongiella sp.]
MSTFKKTGQQESVREVSWMQMVGSSIAAAFGVQSSSNRERDFSHGDIKKFAVAGVLVTFALMFALIGIVQWVLP